MGSDAETLKSYILSLDIGTTTIRSFIYDKAVDIVGRCSCPIKILYPEECAVEINPDSLWEQILQVIKGSIKNASIKPSMIASMGIATQRSTFILWDKESGKPFHDFIVWQDTRASHLADQWNTSFWMKSVQIGSRGLYTFSRKNRFLGAAVLRYRAQHVSMRLLWLFEKYPDLQSKCSDGKVCFGTLDTWVVWRLTKGKKFVSEYSCASATGLYDPYTLDWSGVICGILGIPTKIFPPIMDTSGDFGVCDRDFFGAEIRITAIVGDQQSAMFGECCFKPGDLKLTMGTGAFLDLNVGTNAHASVAGFYPLIGWKIGTDIVHIAEGCANTAGNAIEWLRRMMLIKEPAESEDIAKKTATSEGVYFVPAFNGLQAPVNDYTACGSIMGITQKTMPCHMVRATLESLAFRNRQLFESLKAETSFPVRRFVCDGGVSNNELVVQLTADLIGKEISVPSSQTDMTALGAAFLAGLAVGYWKNKEELIGLVKSRRVFTPNQATAKQYEATFEQWSKATKRSMNWYKDA